MTGWTRDGRCVDYGNDSGSHHICIDLKSTDPNFCEQTGQPNWCSEQGECDFGDQTKVTENTLCDREHWWVVRDLFCDKSKALVIGAVTLISLSQQGVERFPGPDSCGAVSRHSEGGYVSHLIKKSGMVSGLVTKEN